MSTATETTVPKDLKPTTDANRQAWSSALDAIRESGKPGSVTTLAAVEAWFDPLTLLGSSQGRLVVTGPPPHVAWCRKRYEAALNELVPGGVLICDGGGS